MELKELMADFTAKVGLTGVEPDEDGAYTLAFDGMNIAFVEVPDTGMLLLSAFIADKPAEGSERLAEVLLQMNFLFSAEEGNIIALDDAQNRYVLQRRDALALLDGASFSALVESFVNRLEAYQSTIADFVPAINAAAAREAVERSEVSSFGPQGFMQV